MLMKTAEALKSLPGASLIAHPASHLRQSIVRFGQFRIVVGSARKDGRSLLQLIHFEERLAEPVFSEREVRPATDSRSQFGGGFRQPVSAQQGSAIKVRPQRVAVSRIMRQTRESAQRLIITPAFGFQNRRQQNRPWIGNARLLQDGLKRMQRFRVAPQQVVGNRSLILEFNNPWKPPRGF